MTRLRAVRRAPRDERGSSLLEVMVGMAIGLIFLGVFTGAIVMLFQTSNRANALTASSGQTDVAFARLDKSIRYASEISQPGRTTTGWYVEFLTKATGPQVCTQLQLGIASGQLAARTWTVVPGSPATPTPTPSPFVPWASGLTNGNAPANANDQTAPFVLRTTGTNVGFEQLIINLVATNGSPPVPAQTNATFTALNSATAVATGTPSTACTFTGNRP